MQILELRPPRPMPASLAPAAPAMAGDDLPVLFLDFEASSLSAESWPVEIGLAWIAGGCVEVRSSLIAPRRSWSMQHWCAGAERCHGIAADALAGGRPADLVAADTDALAGFHIVSDNPRWDQVWLDRLRAGRTPLTVHPLRQAVAGRLAPRAADAFAMALLRSRAPHRAGADAARLAAAWLQAETALPLAA